VGSDRADLVTGLLVDGLAGPGPAHQRLTEALRRAVVEGRIGPGERLPPSRALATDLGLSRWVVTEAYDQLKAEGYLVGRVGSGTVVSADAAAPPGATTPAEADGPAVVPHLLDVSPVVPDLAAFPRPAWRRALAGALADLADAELGDDAPVGDLRVRTTLCRYLRRVRGVAAAPEDVVLTNGTRHGIAVVCRVLAARGLRRIAVEDPGWGVVRAAAAGAGMQVVPVDVDGGGIRTCELAALDVDAAFVTPAHQFPTGVPLAPDRRRELVRWAVERDGVIIEDDFDAEFRFDRRPIGSVARLAPDHVVHLGTLSKTMAPAMRLGWIAAPPALRDGLLDGLVASGGAVPVVEQRAFALLVERGDYDRHLRRMRALYGGRREAVLAALAERVPGGPASAMAAGLYLLWNLPPDVDEAATVDAARRRGLALTGAAGFRVRPGRPGLVLGFARVPEHRSAEVAETIAAGVRRVVQAQIAQ
jgi:GntR family transcriptional regulator/MocR family aminotransferase